ncbi:hypothetical protein ACP3TJ_02230 [Desulforudis sp. 1088]|uniref:hypothetical protein n=1 Tax=unclassified Candidatus Desulforudis TaxID=2635950 RepID=UPI0034857263
MAEPQRVEQVAAELEAQEWHDLLPIEKKLMAWSLGLGIALLIFFIFIFEVF